MCEFDDYRLESPYEDENKTNECKVCGEPCEDYVCSRKCYEIDLND